MPSLYRGNVPSTKVSILIFNSTTFKNNETENIVVHFHFPYDSLHIRPNLRNYCETVAEAAAG